MVLLISIHMLEGRMREEYDRCTHVETRFQGTCHAKIFSPIQGRTEHDTQKAIQLRTHTDAHGEK